MVIFALLGIIDLIAGIIIVFSSELVLQPIAKYVGLILIAKGIWSLITGLK